MSEYIVYLGGLCQSVDISILLHTLCIVMFYLESWIYLLKFHGIQKSWRWK